MTLSSEIVETVVRYECRKCGNNCRCGVPYVPKTVRAGEVLSNYTSPRATNHASAWIHGGGRPADAVAQQAVDRDTGRPAPGRPAGRPEVGYK